MKGANIVLYSGSGSALRALFSVSPDDAFAASKIQYAAGQAYAAADRSGVPHPSLKVVGESRESGEDGRQLYARFVELDPATLSPRVEGDKGASELSELFKGVA